MKSSEMVNKIRTLLNIQVELEEKKLENGTVVEAESFEKGQEIFIVTEDEKVAMPVGEYILESGELVVVEEEGVIADVREVSDEAPEKEEVEAEEKSEEEKEDLYKFYEELKDRVSDLEKVVEEMRSYGDKEEVEAEAEDATPRQPKSRTIKEEFSENEVNEEEVVEDKVSEEEEVKEELKEELSAPAAEPIKHSPEAKVKVDRVQFAKRRKLSTLDRVLSKINNK
tara:strand:+ start:398 stop:1075 length:678 start_codon:yes stop_codon:yes gene_type:complete